MMTRRHFLGGAAVAALAPFGNIPGAAALTRAERRLQRRRGRLLEPKNNPRRWEALEQDHHTGLKGLFPPGVNDGPATMTRALPGGWQADELIVFQMHANGNTYRHNGDSLETLSPGVWVHGPAGDKFYSGIASVIRRQDGTLLAALHEEGWRNGVHTASIALAESDSSGYSWQHRGTIIEGVELQGSDFRGAASPCLTEEAPGLLHLHYANRYGSGRFTSIHRSTSTNGGATWRPDGEVIAPSFASPHFYEDSPQLRYSTYYEQWLLFTATDSACLVRRSESPLGPWSTPEVVFTKPQEWQQTEGYRRWYPTPLDEQQDDSTTLGRRFRIAEHHISAADVNDRFPTLMKVGVER